MISILHVATVDRMLRCYKDSILCVSYIGYKTIKKPLLSFSAHKKFYSFELIPNITSIDEVKVFAKRKRIRPKQIVEKAIKLIAKNYSNKPFLLQGYYRDYLKHYDDYKNLLEVALRIEDFGFDSHDFENSKVEILQTRFNNEYSYDKTKNECYDNDIMKSIPGYIIAPLGGNELSILRAHNPIRNYKRFSFSFADKFSEDFVTNHDFFLDSVTLLNSEYIYCIDFTYKNETVTPSIYSDSQSGNRFYVQREAKIKDIKGKIYISANNYSIKKIIYTNYFNDDANKGKIYEFVVEYKDFKNKMYLNYLSFSNYFEMPDLSSSYYFKLDSAIYNTQTNKLELHFNNKINPESVRNLNKFNVNFFETKIKVKSSELVDGNKIFLDLDFELPYKIKDVRDKFNVRVRRISDINGNEIGRTNSTPMYQFREFFVNDVKTKHYKAIKYEKACSKTTPLFYYKNDKNPEFWKTYNFIRNKSLLE